MARAIAWIDILTENRPAALVDAARVALQFEWPIDSAGLYYTAIADVLNSYTQLSKSKCYNTQTIGDVAPKMMS